jgi:hypothetical protein
MRRDSESDSSNDSDLSNTSKEPGDSVDVQEMKLLILWINLHFWGFML